MASLYKDILSKKAVVSVIGLGYVGLPIAVAFDKKVNVIGFDTSKIKIENYISGIDPTKELGNELIKNCNVVFTSDENELKKAKFHIVAVPTPINSDKTPDLTPIISASEILGRNLTKGSIVVYESTVYPGVTEDVCVSILENQSNLKCGIDFKIGYSPERINPGDKIHNIENIVKIVSGMDTQTLKEIKDIYELIISVGTYPVSSIKTAEAIKVVENSQRDINIAFMNELAMVFNRMGIDTNEVVEGMNTKWNSLGFRPGLVGGHCIGVDPYYFTYEAERLGYHSQIILAGRKINDSMGEYIADATIKQLILANKAPKSARIAILGITFKENCNDIRNTRVIDIVNRLSEYGITPIISDSMVDKEQAKREYNINLAEINEIHNMDCVIIAVAHNSYKNLTWQQIINMYSTCDNSEKVLIDVKSIMNKDEAEKNGYKYWRL